MDIIELSEDEQNEQLELLVQEGLEARVRNLLSPITHITSLLAGNHTPTKDDLNNADKTISKIVFLTKFYNN